MFRSGYRTRIIDVYTECKKLKVPINFLRTVGFSLPGEGR